MNRSTALATLAALIAIFAASTANAASTSNQVASNDLCNAQYCDPVPSVG